MPTTTPPVVDDALATLERERDVRVCVAAEAGSRAWGYAGPTSDHDIAVVYAQRPADYVVLDGYVASIHEEFDKSADREVDVRAWNLTRVAELLTESNPTVLEALASPTVYRSCAGLDALREHALAAFSPIDCYHHYRSLATGQSAAADDPSTVSRALVVVRAALYARYVRDTHTFPTPVFPVFLDDAGERFPDAWIATARRLVARKRAGRGDEPIADPIDPEIVALPREIDPDTHAVRGIERERVNDFVRTAFERAQQS